jgi:DNA-binding MurR/RpiR family transcriptional regulator
MRSSKRSDANIVQIIQDRYSDLNNTNRKIADFIVHNLEKATFLPLLEISKEIGVSDASLVRFAKKLNFEGFQDLRENLIEYIRKLIYPTNKRSFIKEKGHPLIETVLKKDIEYIQKTMTNISLKDFELLVEMIASAKRTYCMGWGYSSFLAEFLTFGLNFLSFDSISITRERRPLIQQIFNLKDDDVLIVFDLLLYSVEVQEAVEYLRAKNRKVKIITITNDSTTKIVHCADLNFYFDLSGHEFQVISLSAPMCFINSILEQLVFIKREKSTKAMTEFQQFVQANPQHYSQFNPQGLTYPKKGI